MLKKVIGWRCENLEDSCVTREKPPKASEPQHTDQLNHLAQPEEKLDDRDQYVVAKCLNSVIIRYLWV